MKDYDLQPNEVLLYEGTATRSNNSNGTADILLTNLNFVIITKVKKLFSKEAVQVETIPVDKIKTYNDYPQIKQKDNTVTMFFQNEEVELIFSGSIEARKFVAASLKLLTGKGIATRGAERVNGAIDVVDKALGINTVGTVKNVLENGIVGSVLGGIHKKSPTNKTKSSTAIDAITVASGLVIKNNSAPINNSNDIIEALKKLKELLDSGILTQEEFDAKKAELLKNI